jgi:hypothetical protein
MGSQPEYINGPLDGGLVAMQFWMLDTIEFPIDVQIDRVVYVCYTLDDDTKNYRYAGEKSLPRKKLRDR